MEYFLQDESKIKIYAQIQNSLNELDTQSDDSAIDNIISQIPSDFLTRKEDLMVICQLFSYYSRIVPPKKKGNAIKLFEKIMDQIKSLLQDESSFFWNIFGGLFYFKYWMYENGLISIKHIILSAMNDPSLKTAEYFLPEIIEKERELFEKELKCQFNISYTDESLLKFKELRVKHFKWIRESGDFLDPIYREIETNKLRLALKTDDINTFQKILSETNMPIDARIYESTLENFLRFPMSISLIELAIEFNSINIFKFLIMNDAKFDNELNFIAVKSRNYEIIHLLESKNSDKFAFESFISAISCWNDEMKEYIMTNYDFNFLEESDVKKTKDEIANRIADQIFFSSDFMFLEMTFLPFLRKNERYFKENLFENSTKTFSDNSGFFLREFMKCPSLDINCHSSDSLETFLSKAIQERNSQAVEILLNNFSNDDYEYPSRSLTSAFLIASRFFSDVKIIKMFCNHPNFKINSKHWRYNISMFSIIVMGGNVFAIQYIIKEFPDIDNIDFPQLFRMLVGNDRLFSLKIVLKLYLDKNKESSIDSILDDNEDHFANSNEFDKFCLEMKKTYDELTS